jgi:hypothetical protein
MTQAPSSPPAPADSYHCYRCGYNLHGVSRQGLCPECGEPAISSISAAEYLKNSASRSFWVNFSLAIVQYTLVLELVLTALTIPLLVSGLQIEADFVAQWFVGYWLILLTFASYTLFYGITRVNRKGLAVFTRSVLLYLLAGMLVLCALQQMGLHNDVFKFKAVIEIFFGRFQLWCFFLLLVPFPVGFLLFGLWLTSSRSGARPSKRYFFLNAALWLALCLLIFPSFSGPYSMFVRLSKMPYSPYYYGYSATDHMRSDNTRDLNPAYRCDPTPIFWGSLLAQAAYNARISHQQSVASINNQYRGSPPATPNSNRLGNARLAVYHPAPGSVPPAPTLFLLIPETLWLLLGFTLSLGFTIQLFLLTRSARQSFTAITSQS